MNIIKKLFLTTILITSIYQVAQANLDKGVYANMETNKGNILIRLFYKQTPNTVANFVGLAEGTKYNSVKSGKYYDGLRFHRVINNFMIQGGDPKGNGTGGPGYKFADEITNLRHDRPGILSMANAGPDTNGSQFFITHRATPWLDGKHTVFGKVIRGMNIVNKIKQNDNIKTLSIIRVGTEATKFK